MCAIKLSLQAPLEQDAYSDIYNLLVACDDEFCPPLSQRYSTHQAELSPHDAPASQPANGPLLYFNEMKQQSFVLAREDGRLVGFLSYIADHRIPYADEPSAYISTVLVDPRDRGKGIGSSLYAYLENELHPGLITLRTWSTNKSQIALLHKRGYEVIKVLENDRGDGIDTVYFAKKP